MGDNSHIMKTRILSAGLMSASALLLALPVSAATPQQTLNQILAAEQAKGPQQMVITMDINYANRPYKVTTTREAGMVKLHMSLRELPGVIRSGEGHLGLDKVSVTTTVYKMPATNLTYDNPLSLQWKYSDQKVYARLESVAQAIVDELKKGQVDLTPYVGQWYVLDLAQFSEMLKGAAGGLDRSALPLEAMTKVQNNDLAAWKGKSILLVTSVPKRWTDKEGHKLLRLGVRVNPVFVNAMHQAEIKKVASNDPQRRAKMTEINKRYQEMRQSLSRLRFMLNVDETSKTLDRIEIGGTQSEPIKTCNYNFTTNKDVCKTTGSKTTRILMGISILPDNGAPVELPSQATSVNDLLKGLMGNVQ